MFDLDSSYTRVDHPRQGAQDLQHQQQQEWWYQFHLQAHHWEAPPRPPPIVSASFSVGLSLHFTLAMAACDQNLTTISDLDPPLVLVFGQFPPFRALEVSFKDRHRAQDLQEQWYQFQHHYYVS